MALSSLTVPDVEWSRIEKLALVSAVSRYGSDNWNTISRTVKPFLGQDKNVELLSAKNCALKYDDLMFGLKKSKIKLENSTKEELVKGATAERIAELKDKIKVLHANCTQLHVELNEVNSGKYNTHIDVAWEEVQKRKHSADFHALGRLVAGTLAEKKRADSTSSSTSSAIKEEVLDEGHSSDNKTKTEKHSVQLKTEASVSPHSVVVSRSPQLSTVTPPPPSVPAAAPPAAAAATAAPPPPSSTSPSVHHPSSSPNIQGIPSPAQVVSPGRNVSRPNSTSGSTTRVNTGTTGRVISSKTKLSEETSKTTKLKAIKQPKKKPVLPKIKIKALQMGSAGDAKGIVKDKKDGKIITDVFHFDYMPPSGSNPNAQYSSLYQDPKMASLIDKNSDKSDDSVTGGGLPSSSLRGSARDIDSSKIDIDSAAYRSWKKSVLFLWKRAANHKFGNIFMHPVTDELAPGYSLTVHRPMDLSTIKRKIDNNEIRTTAQFHRDMLLMFHNALMYNNASHSVYAITVQMMADIMDVIQDFYNTSGTPSGMRTTNR